MTNAYPDDNPKTIYGDKKIPLHLAPMSAMHALAEGFADGAKKYGPYNWREKTVSSTVYYGAVLRHLAAWFDGEELAEDSGVPHLSHAMSCLAILIDAASIGRLNDNRPLKGASGAIQKAWAEGTRRAYEHVQPAAPTLSAEEAFVQPPAPRALNCGCYERCKGHMRPIVEKPCPVVGCYRVYAHYHQKDGSVSWMERDLTASEKYPSTSGEWLSGLHAAPSKDDLLAHRSE